MYPGAAELHAQRKQQARGASVGGDRDPQVSNKALRVMLANDRRAAGEVAAEVGDLRAQSLEYGDLHSAAFLRVLQVRRAAPLPYLMLPPTAVFSRTVHELQRGKHSGLKRCSAGRGGRGPCLQMFGCVHFGGWGVLLYL